VPPKLAEPTADHAVAAASKTSQLGELIRDLRQARGMTLQELGDAIGKSVGYVSQIERNKSTLTIAALMGISTALGVPMNWFFEDTGNAVPGERAVVVRKGSRRSMRFTNLASAKSFFRRTYEDRSNSSSARSSRERQAARIPTVIPATRPGL